LKVFTFLGYYSYPDFVRFPGRTIYGGRPTMRAYLLTYAISDGAEFRATHEFFIMAQIVDETAVPLGIIRYWLLPLGGYQETSNPDRDKEAFARFARLGDAATAFLSGELRMDGFEVIPALFATPNNLLKIQCDATALDYDKDTNTFRWKEGKQ
jgi:hypothetical protein